MSENKKKLRKRHFDRITLDSLALSRIDLWIKQVESAKAGVVISRKDLINWLIENMAERLSSVQEKSLSEQFYSELRYIQFAAREIKAASLRGERLTLKDIEQRGVQIKKPFYKEKKASKADSRANTKFDPLTDEDKSQSKV